MPDENGNYTKVEYDALVADRDAVKAHNATLFKEAKTAKDALKAWDGKDPAKYDELVAASEEADRKKAAAEGDFTKVQQQMVEQHQKEIKAEQMKTQKALAALEKRKVSKLTEALVKAEVLPEMLDLVVLKGSASVRLRESDTDWEEYVADERGVQLVADGSGTPMGIDSFVQQTLKAQYPGAFKGTGSSGGGAPRSNAGGGGSGSTQVIAAGDSKAFMANLKEIAAGKVTVASQ